MTAEEFGGLLALCAQLACGVYIGMNGHPIVGATVLASLGLVISLGFSQRNKVK